MQCLLRFSLLIYICQICSHGILKYCLRGLLGQHQRKAVFMFIDVCKQLFAEVQNIDELPCQLEKTNLALAQLEKDMPLTIEVHMYSCMNLSIVTKLLL